ncbi:Sister chromatid cohesion protein DCC1 [Nakaseomyces bracarensis]|uniref:Sister chromatid cohesion protein DCC1 n=1 Tax=Nakaseomyces bracarensis TaxID=273131 RepID=A0ABR4P0U6_9SACH
MKLYSRTQHDPSYKLLQLNDDILKAIRNGEKLEFKSMDPSSSDVVICGTDTTWVLKQKNHSNCALVMQKIISNEGNEKDFASLNDTSYEYELTKTPGELNYNLIPIYDGSSLSGQTTFNDLLSNSLCSIGEALKEWHDIGGCIFDNGYICKLSDKFITKVLDLMLTSIMAEQLNFQSLNVKEVYYAVQKDSDNIPGDPYSIPVLTTVLNKFSKTYNEESQTWELDMGKVTKWYGLVTLRKFTNKKATIEETYYPLNHEEFLIKWKSQMPPYFPNTNLEISELRGNYFIDFHTGEITYVDKATLPGDIKSRLVYLFSLQSQWELEEIGPLIEDLNVKKAKFESFLLKYARVKRLTPKRKVVTPR